MKTLASLAVVASLLAPSTASAEWVWYYTNNKDGVTLNDELPRKACQLVQRAFRQKVLTFHDDYVTNVVCHAGYDRDDLVPLTEDECLVLTAMVEEKIGVPKNAVVYADCDPYDKAMERWKAARKKVKDNVDAASQEQKDYLRSIGGQPTSNDHRILMFMPDFLGKSFGNN